MINAQDKRLVALDMDGVVVDGMRYHARAWQDVFASELGIDLPALWVYEWEGIPGDQFLALAARRLGREFSATELDTLHRLKRQHFDTIFEITPIDGIHQTIDVLQSMGYPLALVTGTGRDVAERVLVRLGLREAFSWIVSGDDVARGKPHPDPYRKAAELGAVNPINCLVIENAPAGIEAALAAGMRCAALETSLEAAFLQKADCILQGHDSLRALLASEYRGSGGQGAWQLAACARAQ